MLWNHVGIRVSPYPDVKGCSNKHLLKEEEDHLNEALKRCKYSEWALTRVNIKEKEKH